MSPWRLVLLMVWCAGAAWAQEPPRAVPVSPRVWMVQGQSALGSPANRNFISNAAFIVTDDSVVVVDALGAPALADELLQEIRRVTRLPVRLAIVTHYHADHVYGLQSLKAAGARIVAHRGAQAYLHSDTAAQRLAYSRQALAPWVDERTRLVAADEWIDGERHFEVGGVELRVLPAGPAHTPEDLVIMLPGEGVLIAGDLVFRARVPFVGQADSAGWLASLDHLIDMQPRVIVPGHGPPSRAPRADLELTRDYLRHLRHTMGEAARNLEPFEEAYARADWSKYATLPLFDAANRINAYNTYLLMERAAR